MLFRCTSRLAVRPWGSHGEGFPFRCFVKHSSQAFRLSPSHDCFRGMEAGNKRFFTPTVPLFDTSDGFQKNTAASSSLKPPANPSARQPHDSREENIFLEDEVRSQRSSGTSSLPPLEQHRKKPRTTEDLTTRFFVLLSVIAGGCVVYYFTTYKYTLTTDPLPYKNSMFHHFACDYAVIENKWTGKRQVISLEEELKQRQAEEDARRQEELLNNNQLLLLTEDKLLPPPIITRTIKITKLKDRIYCYLQRKKSLVLVDVHAELAPDRFMTIKENTRCTESMEKSKIAFRRYSGEKGSPSSSSSPHCILLIESILRPLDVVNGYQKGQLPRYEQTLQTVCRELIVQRYHTILLGRVTPSSSLSANRQLHPVLASELLKQGVVNGAGVQAKDIIPDLTSFTEEVRREVCRRMGKEILLYDFSIRLQQDTAKTTSSVDH